MISPTGFQLLKVGKARAEPKIEDQTASFHRKQQRAKLRLWHVKGAHAPIFAAVASSTRNSIADPPSLEPNRLTQHRVPPPRRSRTPLFSSTHPASATAHGAGVHNVCPPTANPLPSPRRPIPPMAAANHPHHHRHLLLRCRLQPPTTTTTSLPPSPPNPHRSSVNNNPQLLPNLPHRSLRPQRPANGHRRRVCARRSPLGHGPAHPARGQLGGGHGGARGGGPV